MISEFHDHGWPFFIYLHLGHESPEKLRNVIEFVNCYETRNHLWVIFEYCAGGDLLRLLKQDSRLPEERAARKQAECKSFGGLLGIWEYMRVPYVGQREVICIQAVLGPMAPSWHEVPQTHQQQIWHVLEHIARILRDTSSWIFKFQSFDTAKVRVFGRQICAGLLHLHSRRLGLTNWVRWLKFWVQRLRFFKFFSFSVNCGCQPLDAQMPRWHHFL